MIIRIDYEPNHLFYVNRFLDYMRLYDDINIIHLYNQILISGDEEFIISKLLLICSCNAVAQKVLNAAGMSNIFCGLKSAETIKVRIKK